MSVLKSKILDETTAKAAESPRLRMNSNLHESYDDVVQRMFNALEPGTIVPIARHPYSNETLIMLRGKLRVLRSLTMKPMLKLMRSLMAMKMAVRQMVLMRSLTEMRFQKQR